MAEDETKETNETPTIKTKIWVCSWNMAAKNHFKMKVLEGGQKVVDESEAKTFESIVPTNYDVWLFCYIYNCKLLILSAKYRIVTKR